LWKALAVLSLSLTLQACIRATNCGGWPNGPVARCYRTGVEPWDRSHLYV
jgi:hypothetical protein